MLFLKKYQKFENTLIRRNDITSGEMALHTVKRHGIYTQVPEFYE